VVDGLAVLSGFVVGLVVADAVTQLSFR